MAIAAFLAFGCGAFHGPRLGFLPAGLIKDSITLFTSCQALPSATRFFATTGVEGDQTTFPAFSAEIVTPLWRQHGWMAAVGFHT